MKIINFENVKRLFSKRSSKEVFISAFKEVLPQKNNYTLFILIIIFSILPSIIIAISIDTIELFVNAAETFNTIILALFGVVFMGYAFFQALINNELLERLLASDETCVTEDSDDTCKKSKLQESNEYFANLMMLDIFIIIVNSFLIITIGSLHKDFHLPINNLINNSLAFVGIWVYFTFVFLVIWEMKSFVYNLFQLFNAHAGSKAIEIIRNGSKN